jgi:tetratricopeptide (TPR) repeat protein
LAVRTKSTHDALRALTGYGALMQEIGHVAEARAAYLKAARRAARRGRKRRAAVAHHYLFALAAESGGTFGEALEHARRAFRLYPIHDPRLPYLAHDFAFLLVRHRIYKPALHLLTRVLPKIDRPDEMIMVLGTLSWAAGGASRPEQFHSAEKAALELVPLYPEFAAPALVTIAWGARTLGKWSLVHKYASMALPLARTRGSAWAEANARTLLEAVECGADLQEETPDARTLELSRRLAARLLRWRQGSSGNRASATHAHGGRG